LGEGFNRDQIVDSGGYPLLSFQVHSTGGDQAVDMRMIVQGTAPGMQDTEYSDEPSHVMGIGGQFYQGLGSGFDQDIVKFALSAAKKRTQFLRHGKDQVKVFDR
jgi:hypothetical protein